MGLNCESVVIYSSEYVCNPNGYFAYTKLFLMQTEKTSKKTQGAELTKKQMNEQFNIATKELLHIFSFEESVKQSLQNVLLGLVGRNEYIENASQQECFDTFCFFLQLSNHLEDMSNKNAAFPNNENPIETYSAIRQKKN